MTKTKMPDTSNSNDTIKNLWESVSSKFLPKSHIINLTLEGGTVTPFNESIGTLKKYAPIIETYGFDLYYERRSTKYWGGLLAREVQKKDDPDKKCLQYLYLWHQQTSAISLHWLVVVPAVLTMLGLLILFLWDPSNFLQPRYFGPVADEFAQGTIILPWFVILILLIETLVTGFGPAIDYVRRKDPNKPNPHYLPAAITFVAYAILGLFMEINPIGWLIFSLSAILFAMGLWAITTRMKVLTSHDMDYLPVFVWLEKINSKWTPMEICYDYWHYFSCKTTIDEEAVENFEKDSENGYVTLRMDNPWHSVYKLKEIPRIDRVVNITVVGAILVGLFYVLGLYVYPPFFVYAWRIFVIVLMVFFLFLMDSAIAHKRHLIYPEDFEENLGFLSHEWLTLLWNLNDKTVIPKGVLLSQGEKDKSQHPRLVVITKMQRPFEEDKSFWTTFRDDTEYIYGILQKV